MSVRGAIRTDPPLHQPRASDYQQPSEQMLTTSETAKKTPQNGNPPGGGGGGAGGKAERAVARCWGWSGAKLIDVVSDCWRALTY